MPIHTIVLEGSLASDQEKTYVHLPFMLPEEAIRLEVAFSYSARIGAEPWLSGGNTIDLGLFDERGIDFQKAGFRGNSGSERSTFCIRNHGHPRLPAQPIKLRAVAGDAGVV